MDKINSLIIDMDGVLWKENSPIGNLQTIFQYINKRGFQVILATNNATLTVRDYLIKLSNFGVVLLENQIVTSSQSIVQYMKDLYPDGGPVYIVGEKGLKEALCDIGFWHSDGKNVKAVIVGLDRHFTYKKLSKANFHIRNGARFIGTNTDNTLPANEGLAPGVGSLLAALTAASGIKPITVGKPKPYLFEIAMQRMNTSPQNTLVIGDRLETDILGGQKLGCYTGFVLSGASTLDDLKKWHPSPSFVANNLTELLYSLP